MWAWINRFASPPTFYAFAQKLGFWLGLACLPLLVYGAVGALLLSPPDYQQGEGVRILYVHVPAAWLSLMIYSVMAVSGGIAVIWRIKLWECVLMACAPVGASFTALALVTGMLWGKPMWGTYWQWTDARLVSELILLFLYCGVIAVGQAVADPRARARACGLLALVGFVNVPIVHFSVQWWNTLHQGPSILRAGGPTIAGPMLWPLLSMIFGSSLFFGYVLLRRAQLELLSRERGTSWVRELPEVARA